MKDELFYQGNDDLEVFVDRRIELGQQKFAIAAATIAGSSERPNEDAFAAVVNDGTLIAAIIDGTSSLKPIAALNGQTGARFASHFIKDHLPDIGDEQTPTEAMLTLNEKLLAASVQLGGDLADVTTLPASVSTLIKVADGENCFNFAHVGDTFGIVYSNDGHSQIFTNNKNKSFDDKMFSLIAEIAHTERISPKQARQDERVKQALRDMSMGKSNNPNGEGCGIINGDPNIVQYVQAGKIDLHGVVNILMGTDGLVPPGWSLESEQDRQKLLAAVKAGGFQRLFELKHQAEDSDPDWNNIRFKHSDDASGILITVD